MSPIAFKILDSANRGIQNAQITVTYRDESDRRLARLSCSTEEDGLTDFWYASYGPEWITGLATRTSPPSVTIAFSISLPDPYRWRHIQAEIDASHIHDPMQVILLVRDTSYLLEYGCTGEPALQGLAQGLAQGLSASAPEYESPHDGQSRKRKRVA